MVTRKDLKQYIKNQVQDEAETGDNDTIEHILEYLSDDELFNCLYDWRQSYIKRNIK